MINLIPPRFINHESMKDTKEFYGEYGLTTEPERYTFTHMTFKSSLNNPSERSRRICTSQFNKQGTTESRNQRKPQIKTERHGYHKQLPVSGFRPVINNPGMQYGTNLHHSPFTIPESRRDH